MRLGIIGCGFIGQKRANAATGHQIVAVADINEATAKMLAAKTGAVAIPWQDLVKAELDIVIIATSHDSLSEIALAAVNAGKHVLVEKPAGRTAAEVKPVMDAAAAKGVLVKVGFNHRFHPAMLKAKEIADSGALGPMMYIRGRYGHGGRIGYDKEWRFQKEISGGGEMVDQGSHLIDLSRWFLGDLKLTYAALPTYFWDAKVEDNCFLALQAEGGQLAWLHATWTEWKNTFSLEISGRDGKLTIEGLGGSYGTEKLTYHRMLPQMGPPETTTWEYPFPDKSWDVEFREFLSAIEQKREPVGSVRDAYEMLRIIDQAYARNA